jgi:hypothetical protein
MSVFQNLFAKANEEKKSPVKYVMMKGNEFTDLDSVVFTEKICSACGKKANVVSARYMSLMQFVRSGGRGAYHHAKLGTWGSGSIPSSSTLVAGHCERCDKSYHLNCVKAIKLGGGTVFRCPVCNSDLAPFAIQ